MITVRPMAFYRLDSDEMTGPLPSLAAAPRPVTRRPLDEHEAILDQLAAMPLPTLVGRDGGTRVTVSDSGEPVPSESNAVSGTRRGAFRMLRRTA